MSHSSGRRRCMNCGGSGCKAHWLDGLHGSPTSSYGDVAAGEAACQIRTGPVVPKARGRRAPRLPVGVASRSKWLTTNARWEKGVVSSVVCARSMYSDSYGHIASCLQLLVPLDIVGIGNKGLGCIRGISDGAGHLLGHTLASSLDLDLLGILDTGDCYQLGLENCRGGQQLGSRAGADSAEDIPRVEPAGIGPIARWP